MITLENEIISSFRFSLAFPRHVTFILLVDGLSITLAYTQACCPYRLECVSRCFLSVQTTTRNEGTVEQLRHSDVGRGKQRVRTW